MRLPSHVMMPKMDGFTVLDSKSYGEGRNEFYGDSVDIWHIINGDLSRIKVYTNGDLRYTVI